MGLSLRPAAAEIIDQIRSEGMEKIRIGLVGCGGMGLRHLESSLANEYQAEIDAVLDPVRPS